MKLSLKTIAIILTLSLSTHVLASATDNINVKLSKSIEEKQSKVILLINVVGSMANDRFSAASEMDKEDIEVAYNSFIARLQNIREEREALERKEIAPDRKTLEDYSLRLNQLMADIHLFLNKH